MANIDEAPVLECENPRKSYTGGAKKGDTEFIKPYAEQIFGRREVCHYAYPREELRREPIFPYFILDGGAYNLLRDRFGCCDGEGLLRLTESGELFREFRHGGEYNWERSFAYTDGTDFRKKYEWQIWPQRLYMTLPVAQAFLRSGDEKYSALWLDIVRGWDAAHPYQAFDPNINYLKTDMVWRDMQVAWRTMALLHGVFMLQDAPFTLEDWKYIYGFTELHVRHLYEEAQDRLRRSHAQNHVLQIGVALIMAAVMLPELEDSEKIRQVGVDTVLMNLRGSIFADGGSDEDSPSYSHFIVRLYLEAYLLLKNNGVELPQELEKSIRDQYRWIWIMSSPTGKTLPISDSYVMDSAADIERASRLIGLDLPPKGQSAYLADSGCAVLKRGRLTLYVDAMNRINGHRHNGRPQILLFLDGEPVITDGGVCNYDRWELYLRLKQTNMHNVVYSPEMSGGSGEPKELECYVTEYDAECATVALECRASDGQGRAYFWKRRLTLWEDGLKIEDEARSDTPLKWRSNLLLARRDTHRHSCETLLQLCESDLIKLCSEAAISDELVPIMNAENEIDYGVMTVVEGYGEKFKNTVDITFEKREY